MQEQHSSQGLWWQTCNNWRMCNCGFGCSLYEQWALGIMGLIHCPDKQFFGCVLWPVFNLAAKIVPFYITFKTQTSTWCLICTKHMACCVCGLVI